MPHADLDGLTHRSAARDRRILPRIRRSARGACWRSSRTWRSESPSERVISTSSRCRSRWMRWSSASSRSHFEPLTA